MATKPRRYVAGRSYKITRRTAGRQYLLTPDAESAGIWLYILAAASRRTGVLIHAAIIMSNHYHLEVTDVEGRLGEFMAEVHGQIARIFNVRLDRVGDPFWDGRKPAVQWIADRSCFVSQTVYIMANPTAAELVEDPGDWPGLIITADDIGKTLTIDRPKTPYFENNRRKNPEQLELYIAPPPGHQADDFRDRVQLQLDNRVRELAANRTTPVCGLEHAMSHEPTDSPSTPDRRGQMLEEVIASDTELRLLALAELDQFRRDYQVCRRRLRHDKTVVFPGGTYALKRWVGVEVAESPPPTPVTELDLALAA